VKERLVSVQRIGVIMNGVTGRMGTNQHLVRSILAIREQGGLPVGNGPAILPEPLLVGRNASKLEALAARAGGARWTTSLDEALADPNFTVYFDAQTTDRRADAVRRAIAAGKHVYCEKPLAATLEEALELAALARSAGIRNGVVQDKLWLPGIVHLRRLVDRGFFGRMLSVRGEFGYWVFDGESVPAQRPSWNYRADEGGGITFDMFAHWRYVLDALCGGVKAVCCLGATHVPQRWDELGRPYEADADDAAYAMFELANGAVAQFNSSWCVRVRRDDLLAIQVDGTGGSAVAGLRRCWIQPAAATPRPVWNPDEDVRHDYRADWQEVPDEAFGNAFEIQWEHFLRHVVCGEPFPWDFLAGARGVQLAELAVRSWRSRAWVPVPPLGVGGVTS
jgi:predicted dehydrogenase